MDFLRANIFNTTTMMSVTSNASRARYLIDGNPLNRYISSGETNTVTVFNLVFSEPTVISHLILLNQNFDEIYIYYDNTSTNFIYFNCSNSAENLYINVGSTTVSSIQVVVGRTMTIGDEKRCGGFIATEKLFSVDNPSFKNFEHKIIRNQIVHKMPDGGDSIYNVRDNFRGVARWDFLSATDKENLFSLFSGHIPFIVVPDPEEDNPALYEATPNWDGGAHEVEWSNEWNFKPTTLFNAAGYSGSMDIKSASQAR